MVLAIGRERTTLYDQIAYSGSPSEFAWVLPITGEVEVGLSSDVLFAELDAATGTVVEAPPLNCPPPTGCGGGGGFGCSGATSTSAGEAFAAEDAPPPVTVTRQEVVGPYATVQLQSRDPEALAKWLEENGYALPDESRAVVKQYVAEHFDFLALKLRPGQSVQAMRPVRVTSRGASVVLPLRMVAAGAGANVGITLFTVAEGRYEPKNFPFFRVEDSEIEWRWSDSSSTFREVRSARAATLGGRGWEMESSIPIQTGVFPRSGDTRTDPTDGYLSDGARTASSARAEDIDLLFDGRTSGATRVTRMRADLTKAALAEDLLLGASVEQGQLPNVRRLTREIGEPSCTVWEECRSVGTAPRSEAARQADACSTSGTGLPEGTWQGAFVGFAALALARRARARRALRS